MPLDWFPFWLSLRVAVIASVIAVPLGLWLAHILENREFRWKGVLEAAITLPLVMPASVLGFFLLVLLGEGTILGRIYEWVVGAPLIFTWQAAVVAALFHAIPFMVRQAREGFGRVDGAYLRAAQSLGASQWRVFWKVTLPLEWRALAAAAVLAFARAFGDFGLTLMIAGNLPSKTQTLAVAVFDAAQKDSGQTARAFVLVLSATTLLVLFLMNRLDRKRVRG